MTVTQTEIDFKPEDYQPRTAGSREELLTFFDETSPRSAKVLAEASDAELMQTWTLKKDGKPCSARRASASSARS